MTLNQFAAYVCSELREVADSTTYIDDIDVENVVLDGDFNIAHLCLKIAVTFKIPVDLDDETKP